MAVGASRLADRPVRSRSLLSGSTIHPSPNKTKHHRSIDSPLLVASAVLAPAARTIAEAQFGMITEYAKELDGLL